MKKRNLIWATFLSLIVAACLISVPALSGENPWDADGGNGGGTGSPFDSTLLDAGGLNYSVLASNAVEPYSGGSEPTIITRITIRLSSYFINYFQRGTLKKAPINRIAD